MTTITRTMIGEGEYKQETVPGVYHGLSIYRLSDGTYEMTVRARSYDGIKVQDKWDSQPIQLEATSDQAARTEANRRLREFVLALTGRSS